MSDPEFTLLGDAIWLDFVNTARGRTLGSPDQLPDAAAYHRWTKALKLRSDAGERAFTDVIRLRTNLTTLAQAFDSGERPPAPAIATINDLLQTTTGVQQLTRIGGEWRLRFAASEPPTAFMAIARSAAGTLANPLVFVRQCAGAECSLFFSDDSPSQGRRWCSADACGHAGWVERRRGLLR
jgi:predicted RNA-binding Zn ribbon-like protein